MKNLIIAAALMISLNTLAKLPAAKFLEATQLQEKQYKKIDVSAVDKAALEKIKKSYGTYTIKEAYKAEDGEYKLVLNKDGVDLTATFTPAGDLIKIY